jgi:hypothetical protein
MPSRFAGALVVVGAAVALCAVGYRQMRSKPVLHEATPAACSQQAIKEIGDITERAIQSSRCARLLK